MKKVLNIGQCALDNSNIGDMLKSNFEVEIKTADSHDQAIEMASQDSYDLILVNRLYDIDRSAGQTTIEQLCSMNSGPVMLVSNYDDAQKTAMDAGAAQGFGKANLNSTETIGLLKNYLNQ